MLIAGADWAGERMARRKFNEPDEDDEDDFARALGSQLAIWFPDSALTPGKQLIMSGAFIAGTMCIGSEKLPPPPPALSGVKEQKANGATASTSDAAPAAPSTSTGPRLV